MTPPDTNQSPESEEELRAAISELLKQAEENGVDIPKEIPVESSDEAREWMMRLTKSERLESDE